MSSLVSVLAVVCDELEAQRALKLLAAEKNFVIIALSISAEYYIEQKLPHWRNPIYSLLEKDKSKSSRYVFENFSISYNFCDETNYKYIRDRLGYFLAELGRSLDLAAEAIRRFEPKKLIIGEIKNFPGSSVVDGTLKTNAFFLFAKEGKIPYQLIGLKKNDFSLRQNIGKKIQLLRHLSKQRLPSYSDLLILATPRHLIQMAPIINEAKRSGIDVLILTYSVTAAVKRRLSENVGAFLEKERLIDHEIKDKAVKLGNKLIKSKMWDEFTSPKYQKNSVVLKYIRWKIEDIIKNEMSEILHDLFLAEKIFLKLKPKALLTTTDPDSKILTYIDKARENGVKTICIQHGAFYGKDSPAIYPTSDYFVAWSKTSKEWLKRGDYFKGLKILVGNSPFHHQVKTSKKISTRNHLTILYLATKHPTVDKNLVLYYLKILFETLSKVDTNLKLIVRVHPYQDMSNLKSLVDDFKHRAEFANDCSLLEAIAKSDLVIYENTTAGFDAMLAGKPTIYFNPYSGEDFFNIKAHQASLSVLNQEDIEKKIPRYILNKKNWQKFATRGRQFAKRYLGLENSQGQGKLVTTIVDILKLKNA